MTNLWSDEIQQAVRLNGRNLDQQVTPPYVQMCTRCVMTNQRPRISFNDAGLCSACQFKDEKDTAIDWAAREAELEALLTRHRRKEGFDVVVPSSGGKDSAYVAHQLRHRYGMRPLLATFTPFMYTDIGRRNYEALRDAGFDTMVFDPNGQIHRKLARLSFEYLGDPFQPFAFGQMAWPLHVAKMLGINLVMFGENGEAERGGDTSANHKPCWDREDWKRVYYKGAGVEELAMLGSELGAFDVEECARIMHGLPYRPPVARGFGAECHWFSYYTPWDPMANFYYAAEHCGFSPADERQQGTYTKFASLDDKLDGLHYYLAYIKFGIGRCTADAADQVRHGHIEREEAVALVERYDGEFPERHLGECLDYLGIDRDHLQTLTERFRCPTK